MRHADTNRGSLQFMCIVIIIITVERLKRGIFSRMCTIHDIVSPLSKLSLSKHTRGRKINVTNTSVCNIYIRIIDNIVTTYVLHDCSECAKRKDIVLEQRSDRYCSYDSWTGAFERGRYAIRRRLVPPSYTKSHLD